MEASVRAWGVGHEAIQGRPRFLRVQCKTAWVRGGCALFNCRMTDHGGGSLPYIGLADIFGVYLPPRDSMYLVPIDAVADTEGRLRLEPARNNQQRRVRLAVDYEVERWTADALREVAVRPSEPFSPRAHAK